MGRPQAIEGTALQARVDHLLRGGASIRETGRAVGATFSSVQRYAATRKPQLARAFDGQANVFDVVARLLNVADDARDTRIATKGSSPSAHSAAIKSELAALSKLLLSLGVEDARDALEASAVGELARAVRDHIEHDTYAADLIDRLAEIEAFHDIAATMRRQIAPVT